MKDFITWTGYVGMVVIGVIAYVFPARKKQLDDATRTLIETLQETVDALKEDLDTQKTKIKTLETNQAENIQKIKDFEYENQMMKDLLRGQDEDTKAFRKEAYASMETTNRTLELVQRLVTVVENNTKGIEKNNDMTFEFVKTLREHFLTVEKAAINK